MEKTLQERLDALSRDQAKMYPSIPRLEKEKTAAEGALAKARGALIPDAMSTYAAAFDAIGTKEEPSPVGSSYAASAGVLKSASEQEREERIKTVGQAQMEFDRVRGSLYEAKRSAELAVQEREAGTPELAGAGLETQIPGGIVLNKDKRAAMQALEVLQMAEKGNERAWELSPGLQYLSGAERQRFLSLVGAGQWEKAGAYIQLLQRDLNARFMGKFTQTAQTEAAAHPWKGAADNVGYGYLQPLAYGANAVQALKNAVTGEYEPTDVNAPVFIGAQGAAATARGVHAAAEEAGGFWGGFAADTGLSIANMAAKLPFGPTGSLAYMGASAAGGNALDALERGATPGRAFATSTAAGAVEVLTEKLPLENVFRMAKAAPESLKAAVVAFLKQMGVEATEEAISEVANNVVDQAVMGDKSEYELYVRQLMENGVSEGEARRKATRQFYLYNVGMSALGGAVAGGIMSGGAQMVGTARSWFSSRGGENITPRGVETTDGGETEVQLPATPGEQKTASTPEAEAGLIPVSETMRESLSTGKNNFIAQAAEDIVSFVKRALGKKGGPERLYMGTLPDAAAKLVKNKTGVDVKGYNAVLPGDSVQHIFKNHGDPLTEAARGQRAVTADDIALLPQVMAEPDSVSLAEKTDTRGRTVILFSKKIGDTFITAQAVSDGRKSLATDTFWIKKGGPTDTGYNADIPVSPVHNAQSEPPSGPSSDTIISQTGDGVKGEFSQEGDPLIQAMLGQKEFTPEGGKISGEEGPVGVGAAAEGFTSGAAPETRTSRVHDSTQQYNRIKAEAAGILEGTGEERRGAWRELFSYKTQSEERSMQRAGELLYAEIDGRREFIRDFDPDGYSALLEELESAPAWDGVQTDASQVILDDLLQRVAEGRAPNEEYARWLQVDKDHSVSTAQGLQARAKWSRDDNGHGHASSLEAWENLERSKLTPEERTARFNQVVGYNQSIEAAESAGELTEIILEIAGERGTLNGLTGKQSQVLRSLAQSALCGLDVDQLRQFAYQSATALTMDNVPADLGRKLKTVQILNMLSNPKTAAKNLTGNTTFYALDALTMRAAALLDMAVSKLTGTRSVAMEGNLLTDAGAREATVRAVQMSLAEITLDVDMGGNSRYNTGSNRTFKARGGLVERVLSAIERNQGYLLTTTDELYKGMARATERGTQRLVEQGKIRSADPDYAGNRADELAKYRTFQNGGKLSSAIQSIHDLLNMAVGIGDSGKRSKGGHVVHAFGTGDLVAPFTKVAGNLASVGLDYSPVNAVKGTVELVDVLRRTVTGERVDAARQYRAVSDVARGLTGTAIAMGFAALAQAGLVKRAGDEEDQDIAALNRSEGMTGTQINIDAAKRWVEEDFSARAARWRQGDTLIDLSNLEPINFMVSLGVELAGNGNDGILSTFGDVNTYKDTMLSAAETAGDLPILQSVGTFAKDTMVYKKDPLEAAAEMLGKTAISSVTPNIVAAFAKGLDGKQRSAYSGDGVKDVLVDTFLSRIPVLRESLPTVVDTVGKEKENAGELPQRLLNAMLNPIGVNEYTQSEVSREMERVREETGKTDFYPTTRKPKEIGYTDKEGQRHEVSLSYEDRQRFQASCAAEQMAVTTAMMDSEAYRKASGEEQAALLKRCYDYAYQKAKGAVLGEEAAEAWVRNADRAKEDIGLSTVEYLCYYEKYGSELLSGSGYERTRRMVGAGLTVDEWAVMKGKLDADGSGSVNKKELTGYIEANFPKEQWSGVFRAYVGGGNWKNPY